MYAEETVRPEKPAEADDTVASEEAEDKLPDFMALEDFLKEPAHTPETKKKSERKKATATDSWELEGQLSFEL